MKLEPWGILVHCPTKFTANPIGSSISSDKLYRALLVISVVEYLSQYTPTRYIHIYKCSIYRPGRSFENLIFRVAAYCIMFLLTLYTILLLLYMGVNNRKKWRNFSLGDVSCLRWELLRWRLADDVVLLLDSRHLWVLWRAQGKKCLQEIQKRTTVDTR